MWFLKPADVPNILYFSCAVRLFFLPLSSLSLFRPLLLYHHTLPLSCLFLFFQSFHFFSLLCYILHFAMVTTADPEHLSHLNHFIRYLIVPFQIKRSNCVYKSPLGFQALFLGHIFLKSNTHPHTDTHSHITGSSRSRRGLFLITFNASPNKQMVDWFCWARLYCSG